jgi:ABC-type transport system substrate-binding protein
MAFLRSLFCSASLALGLGLLPALASTATPASSANAAPKHFRFALSDNPSGFDPAQISDVVSAAITQSLFDTLLTYDYWAQPAKLKPRAAAALPEHSENYTRWVFKLKPGILFADDPVFKGQPRELVAADFVYAVKRHYDPKTRSPTLFQFENLGLLGLSELRKQAQADKKPFPYDVEAEGARVLDRYTLEFRTSKPAPRLPYLFANLISSGVAREAIEAYDGRTMERPVGTGPFVLKQWVRGLKVVLERNPRHQHTVWDETADPQNPQEVALAAKLRGRKLPMLDSVEVAFIDESQPRWLAFAKGEIDYVIVPQDYTQLAAPGRRIAPNLAKAGVQLHLLQRPATFHTYFNIDDPVVGGLSPERVALRRAIALAYDTEREINLVRKGAGIPAQTVLPPGVSGYSPALRTEMSVHSVARAKALLDTFGYRDRDGDGFRENPDGSALEVVYTTEPDQLNRQLQGIWDKGMKAIGVRMKFEVRTWVENLKASRAGSLMMWGTGWVAVNPDGGYFLDLFYGPNKGQSNRSRFVLPAFDRLYEQQAVLPDGPERDAVIQQALKLGVAYMPYKARVHGLELYVTQPGVVGFKPHPYMRDFFRYLDIERDRPVP